VTKLGSVDTRLGTEVDDVDDDFDGDLAGTVVDGAGDWVDVQAAKITTKTRAQTALRPRRLV